MHVKNWEARRSGMFQVVTGEDADGSRVKIAGVVKITPAAIPGYCYATDRHGEIHKLAV